MKDDPISSKSAEESPKQGFPDPNDVLLLLDDVKDFEVFEMTRFGYFAIDPFLSVEDWNLALQEQEIPFLLFGGASVIHRPTFNSARFETTAQFDSLIDRIEEIDGLVVENGYIWLPNFLLEDDQKWTPQAQQPDSSSNFDAAWRCTIPLFQEALRFMRGLITQKELIRKCLKLAATSKPMVNSPAETIVLRNWGLIQIEQARKNYLQQRSDGYALDYLDKDGERVKG
ncbi:MAG: hypothetical protein ABFS17_11625 [Chloroflexota bacterium]